MSQIQKFLFEQLPVRGVIVRLTDTWQEILRRRKSNHGDGAYPLPVQNMLGEMLAGAALLKATITFNGSLVLQVQGAGPVQVAVAELMPDWGMRATATIAQQAMPVIPEQAGLPELINHHGKGRCAITLDPANRLSGQQPYQGIVPLVDEQGTPLPHMSAALEHYMRHSEQLETTLVLAADENVAAGLLIQRLPVEGVANLAGSSGADENDDGESHFQRLSMLAQTLQKQELLNLSMNEVLHRLFWNEKLLRFAPTADDPVLHFACTCSRKRVADMLLGLGREEADSILAEQGQIEIDCAFCSQKYRFDKVEVAQIFTPPVQQPPVNQLRQ